MNRPSVIRRRELTTVRLSAGNALLTRIIWPESGISSKLFLGIAECTPGDSPHRWHVHTRDSVPEAEYIYPKGFEEFYYVVRGSATLQWKAPDGTIHEEPASEGDTIYMPPDVMEHQVLNTGKETLTVFYGMTPPVKIEHRKGLPPQKS